MKFLVMYVHVFKFCITCLLMYFHNKTFLMNTYHFVISVLRRLDDFAFSAIANLFISERLKIPEACSEPSQKSKMELFSYFSAKSN